MPFPRHWSSPLYWTRVLCSMYDVCHPGSRLGSSWNAKMALFACSLQFSVAASAASTGLPPMFQEKKRISPSSARSLKGWPSGLECNDPESLPGLLYTRGKAASRPTPRSFCRGASLSPAAYYLHHKLVQAQAPGQVTRRSGLPSARLDGRPMCPGVSQSAQCQSMSLGFSPALPCPHEAGALWHWRS